MDPRACRTIIVFGGTFDPPHVAHVTLPRLVMQAIGADAVAYVPAAVSPHKRGQAPTPAALRLEMLRLALRDEPWATVLTDELDRAAADGRPSYTVETLESLRARWGADVTMRLLIGADQLRAFHLWHQAARIVELAEPAVMVRPPATRESMLASLPAGTDVAAWARRLVDVPVLDVSATEIRRRVRAGESIAGLVTPQVERYIAQQGVYRDDATT